jgi:hypothetical protein
MRLYVGLGKNTVAQRLEIEWPRGKKQVLENVPADQLLTLDESGVGQDGILRRVGNPPAPQ